MADSEKTVAIKFVIDSKSAMDNLNRIIVGAEQIKKQFAELTGVSKSSFAKIAEAMKMTKAEEIKTAIAKAKTGEGLSEAELGLPKAQQAEAIKTKIAELNKELLLYNRAMDLAVNEMKLFANAEQQFSASFNNKPLEEQLQIINEINSALRNRVQTSGVNLLDKNQLKAVENAQVRTYAQQRLAQVPLAQPGEKSTGAYEATAFKAASDDIRNYRALVKTELNKIVGEYRNSQKQIEAEIKDSAKRKLDGERQYFNADIALKKEQTKTFLEEARKQREEERAGLTGGELETKAKEQADAAIAAYQQANEAYKQQIEVRKNLAKQLITSQDEVTANELDEAKKREAALKVESDALKQNATNAKQEYKKIAEASKQTSESGSALLALGNVAKYVFGTIFGITAISAVRNFMRYLSDAGQQAIQYTKILFTLGLAVRQMERKGQPTTVSQLKDEIADFRKEFSYFSQLEVTKAFAEATNKLSNLGYTAQQVANVVRIGMVVYTTDLTGRFNDLGEAINGVTNYLASGYGESLERSGFISGRAGDKIAAYEMGLGKTLATLDPLTLSQTRYNLIMGQAAEKSADAAQFIGTLAGQYQSASAAIVDANVEIGKSVDNIVVKWQQAKAAVLGYIAASLASSNVRPEFDIQIEKLAKGYNEASKQLDELTERRKNAEKLGAVPAVLKYYDDEIQKLKETKEAAKKTFMEFTYAPGMTEEGLNKIRSNLDDLFADIEKRGANKVLTLNGIQMSQETQTRDVAKLQAYLDGLTSEVTAIVEPKVEPNPSSMDELNYKDTLKKILAGAEDVLQDHTKRSIDIWNDYVNKVGTNADTMEGDIRRLMNYDGTEVKITVKGEIETDFLRKIQDINIDYQNKINEIQADTNQKLADAQKNYYSQAGQATRQYNNQRAQAERQYRLKEIQAERQFQEEMRKLREGYLMDLEGALRERDALQVIRLSREYTLQKEQATRQFAEEKRQRKENFDEERKQAAIEQSERAKQLAEEFASRKAAIIAEGKQAEAQALADKKKAEAEAQLAKDRAIEDAKAQYNEQRTQLEIETQANLEAFGAKLKEEGSITDKFLAQFKTQLEGYFGKNATYDQILKIFEQNVANTAKAVESNFTDVANTMAKMVALSGQTPALPSSASSVSDQVLGAVNKPTDVTPVEIPVSISAEDLNNQVETAVSDINKTVTPIEIPSVVLPPASTTEKAQPTVGEQPLELPIVVSNEGAIDEIKAGIDEAKALRDENLANLRAENEADINEIETESLQRAEEFRKSLTLETANVSTATDDFMNVLRGYFGNGAGYDQLMKWFETRTEAAAQRATASIIALGEMIKWLRVIAKGAQEATYSAGAQAATGGGPPRRKYSGGAEVFSKPTTIRVSEYEPEFVEITPLSKLSRSKAQDIVNDPSATTSAKAFALSKVSMTKTNATFNNGSTQFNSIQNISNASGNAYSPGNQGLKESTSKIFLTVALDQSLYAQIVDQSLSETADVIMNVMRMQR